MKKLVIVAHPDDELLWFSSVLLRNNCDIVCVTSGRDSQDILTRTKAFKKTMNILDIKSYEIWKYPDTKERLDIHNLQKDFAELKKSNYDEVYTHGPYGETHNQRHHQDVSYAANSQFNNVYSIAWNLYPDIINILTPEEYNLKKQILGTIYAKEYDLIMDAYEISAIEKFTKLNKESVEIYYFGIANFGNHHDFLGKKYPDFWGFKNSPYEIDRHAMITGLVEKSRAKKILEYGSCEGVLTDKLSTLGTVDCVENVDTYKRILQKKGYAVIDNPITKNYDISIIAAFLEYVPDPKTFLDNIHSNYLLIDVITDSELDKKLNLMLPTYECIEEKIIAPRWEKMYHDTKKEKLDIYRLGAHGHLYKRK